MTYGPTKKAEPPPTRDVNRDSGTDSANGGWLRRLVRPLAHVCIKSFLPRVPDNLPKRLRIKAKTGNPIGNNKLTRPQSMTLCCESGDVGSACGGTGMTARTKTLNTTKPTTQRAIIQRSINMVFFINV